MKKLMKLTFVLFSLAMCLCLSVAAQASDVVTYEVEGGSIQFNTLTRTVTDCDSTVTAAEIPAKIEGVPVVNIGTQAFYSCGNLTKVTLPEGVTAIEASAFWNCTALESINIPSTTKTIGGSAFRGCTSLKSLAIPETVTSIGSFAFQGCTALESVNIPKSFKSVGNSMFAGCTSLKSITIPAGVTSIGSSAFSGCTGLKSIAIPAGVTFIDSSAFSGCTGLTAFTIPAGLTQISNYMLSGCTGLESITIPAGIQRIGSSAFSGCTGLLYVEIPASVEEVAAGAFARCANLEAVRFGAGTTYIQAEAFYGCSKLRVIGLPAALYSAGYQAFEYCYELSDIYYAGTAAQWGKVYYSDQSGFANATVHYGATMPNPTVAPFTDVPLKLYYARSVRWAVDSGITNGTTETTFSPDRTCTKANILTFLWRAYGSPVVEAENTFSDVKETDYFYGAALWAKSLGLTSGDKFNPNTPCTRGDTVYYMYVAAGKPAISTTVGFTDVPASAYYAKAVAWAVEAGVTNGVTATTFAPGRTCTRGQIVTFLYRGLAEK